MLPNTQNLPLGIQSFPRIIKERFLYVDKTKYIHDIIESGDYFFLARPPGFGKSLLLSTIYEIFAGRRELFDSLAIAQTDYSWEEHPVIHLNFSSLSITSPQELKADLERMLLTVAEEYNVTIDDAPSLKTKFYALISRLATSKRVVILIDDYDYPIISTLDNLVLSEEFRTVLHDFFPVIKDVADYRRFVLIVGISKFSPSLPLSGLNNLTDLSLNERAAHLVGYTERELKNYVCLRHHSGRST